jgi:hypothetical protein
MMFVQPSWIILQPLDSSPLYTNSVRLTSSPPISYRRVISLMCRNVRVMYTHKKTKPIIYMCQIIFLNMSVSA